MLIVYHSPAQLQATLRQLQDPFDAFPTKALGAGRCHGSHPRSNSSSCGDDNSSSSGYSYLDIRTLYLELCTPLRPDTTSRVLSSSDLYAPSNSFCP